MSELETFAWMLPLLEQATDPETGLVDDAAVDGLWAQVEARARAAGAARGED